MTNIRLSTRAATYQVIINCFKFLPKSKLDAAWGVSGLVSLYAIRALCDALARRYPQRSELSSGALARLSLT